MFLVQTDKQCHRTSGDIHMETIGDAPDWCERCKVTVETSAVRADGSDADSYPLNGLNAYRAHRGEHVGHIHRRSLRIKNLVHNALGTTYLTTSPRTRTRTTCIRFVSVGGPAIAPTTMPQQHAVRPTPQWLVMACPANRYLAK